MKTITVGKGFTLIEAVVVVAMIAIVITLAIPGGGAMVEATQRRTLVADLVGAFAIARNTSIQEKVSVTLCALDSDGRCTKDWTRPVTVFRDPGRLRALADPAQIIRVVSPPKRGAITVNTGNRRYFGFRPTGMARAAIGNLVWCPDDGNPEKAIQFRINMGGRLQQAKDRNGDGVVEGANGRAIVCS